MPDPLQARVSLPAHPRISPLFARASAVLLRLYGRLPAWTWAFAFLALLGLWSMVTGAGQSSPTALSANSSTDLLALGTSVVFKLGLVIVLIYGSMFLFRRWRVSFPTRLERQINILETARLSPRQAIHLVRVKDQLLLIGATDQGLSLLTEFESPAGEEVLAPTGPAAFEQRLEEKVTKSQRSTAGSILALKTSEVPSPQMIEKTSSDIFTIRKAQEAP